VLKFKLSQLLFLEENFKEAQKNLEEALEHDFNSLDILKKIKTLKGMVDQAMSRY